MQYAISVLSVIFYKIHFQVIIARCVHIIGWERLVDVIYTYTHRSLETDFRKVSMPTFSGTGSRHRNGANYIFRSCLRPRTVGDKELQTEVILSIRKKNSKVKCKIQIEHFEFKLKVNNNNNI